MVYLIKRLGQSLLVLYLLVTVSFFLIRLAPGGPFSQERNLDPVVEQALNAKYQLDRPILTQYRLYLTRLLHGDLGPSIKHKTRSVNEIVFGLLPHSLWLGTLALGLALMLGLTAGTLASMRHNGWSDAGIMLVAVIGISVPTFVVGPVLQLIFGMHLKWLPVAAYEGPLGWRFLVLPALTLALPFAARIARLMRAGMLDVLSQEFVVTARAKGLTEPAIVVRHCLRLAVLPVVSYLGPAVAMILTGSLVVEQIFQVPGLGREFVESALSRDYFLVLGTVIVYGALLIACNVAVDFAYRILDPRIRHA